MPKKFINKFLPDHKTIREQKFLKLFGSMFQDPNLWHLNRHSASGAFGIGLFFAFWPVPFHMWLSAFAAIPLRVNLPLSIATVWLTNPLTMPPIFYGAYKVGAWVLGTDVREFEFQLSWEWLMGSVNTIGPAFLLGCMICSVVFGSLGYATMSFLWRRSVIKSWQARRAKRQCH